MAHIGVPQYGHYANTDIPHIGYSPYPHMGMSDTRYMGIDDCDSSTVSIPYPRR